MIFAIINKAKTKFNERHPLKNAKNIKHPSYDLGILPSFNRICSYETGIRGKKTNHISRIYLPGLQVFCL